jgi:hypothetical protein
MATVDCIRKASKHLCLSDTLDLSIFTGYFVLEHYYCYITRDNNFIIIIITIIVTILSLR